MDGSQFGNPRPVVVGGVYAYCTHCGSGQFVRMGRDTRQKADTVLCADCGAEHQYIALLKQILETVRESSEKLRREAGDIRRQSRDGNRR